MGNLPSIRVTPSMPFSHCGVDYAGPILIKEGNRRSKKTIKSYIALFKCFATKAVHIEIVTDATCEAFLAALKRFMARRGKVSSIHSDNATYFTAANRELTKLFTSANFQNENHPVFKATEYTMALYTCSFSTPRRFLGSRH
jgi:hypothetical protein